MVHVYVYGFYDETRFLCETQMPLIKDKNLVTRNAHVQYESSNIYYLEVMTNVN